MFQLAQNQLVLATNEIFNPWNRERKNSGAWEHPSLDANPKKYLALEIAIYAANGLSSALSEMGSASSRRILLVVGSVQLDL